MEENRKRNARFSGYVIKYVTGISCLESEIFHAIKIYSNYSYPGVKKIKANYSAFSSSARKYSLLGSSAGNNLYDIIKTM